MASTQLGPDEGEPEAAQSSLIDAARQPRAAFAALAVPNFRRFVSGQAVSLIGSWTETVAQALLVLQLTHSPTTVGFVTAARYLPVLLLTPYAGLIIDRNDKRRILILAGIGLALLSLVVGTLVLTGYIALWSIFVAAILFGLLSAFDNPARQAFIPELVGRPLIKDAVTLNSTFVNVGRAVGPVVAALLISTIGIGWCFIVNALSFAAVLYALMTMRVSDLYPVEPIKRAKQQLIEGLRYAVSVPSIILPIAMMALIGTLTYEFEVSLPAFALVLDDAETTYSWLIGAFGVGSVSGGLYCMWRPETGLNRLLRAAGLYAAAMTAVSCAPNLIFAVLALFVVGCASITFITTGNSTIQLEADPAYRGRITALWSTAFLGSTPIGAPIIGYVASYSARLSLLVGASACGLALLLGWRAFRWSRR